MIKELTGSNIKQRHAAIDVDIVGALSSTIVNKGLINGSICFIRF